MKLTNPNSAIILPLKENYTISNFGAVSIWVSDYINETKIKNNLIFCKKKNNKEKYLTKNIYPVEINSSYFTNQTYIKKINSVLLKKKIDIVEIHNRPEYALYLIKNNPGIKINLIFHNDPNKIRYSDSNKYKDTLINKCNKVIFVSKWVKSQFFKNYYTSHKNNTDIIYNFIKPLRKMPPKKNIIIFSGKLNKSKGYDIFCKVINKVLDKYKNWNALIYGDEPREEFNIRHDRLKVYNWIKHKSLLKIYEKTSISVVNPTWDEPFGRTAMESASRGCAVITSKSGGLSETFINNLVLKKNNPKALFNKICHLIENKKFLGEIQKNNFKNVIHKPSLSINKLDQLRSKISYLNKPKKKNYKILHVANFGIKVNHRLFNISISNKLSNGFIRNGHDVINFDFRNINNRLFKNSDINKKVIEIVKNYRPDLILFGHNNILKRSSLLELKKIYNCKLAIWYEDHVMKGDPNYKNNIDLIEKNNDLIDKYFITTSPDIIKTNIKREKIKFLPIPVDPNIESEKFFETTKSKDLFFGLSHGVNYGKLKKKFTDERTQFINDLIKKGDNKFNYHFLGIFNEEPKWNYEFNNEVKISKTALNLSRGGPSKYCSSNRIASLMGNGILPFIDEKIYYQDFFNNDEIITYKNVDDLLIKLEKIISNNKELIRRSKNAKKSYFSYFENTIVADSIINSIYDTPKKYKYIWNK